MLPQLGVERLLEKATVIRMHGERDVLGGSEDRGHPALHGCPVGHDLVPIVLRFVEDRHPHRPAYAAQLLGEVASPGVSQAPAAICLKPYELGNLNDSHGSRPPARSARARFTADFCWSAR